MQLSKDLREFVELLNSNGVEYLVVGGFAVAWHGYPRFTADIDFFLRSAPANAEAVVRTLRAFGFESLRLTAADFTRPDQIVQLGAKPNRIDLLTSISGVEFEAAWPHREQGSLDGVPVAFVGLEDLLCNKDSTGRPQDLADAGELRKRRGKTPSDL